MPKEAAPTVAGPALMTIEDREKMMDRFSEQGEPPVEEARPEPKPEAKKEEYVKPSEPKDLKEEARPSAVTPTEKGDPAVTPVKGDDVKMVPHGALHEEREKHKQTKSELSLVKQQLETVLQDFKTLIKEPPKTDVVEDYEKEILALKTKVAELEKVNQSRSEFDAKETARRAKETIQSRIQAANERLESEGFPGFSEFTPLVTQELQRLVAEDEGNAYLDTPEGWMKIYRETVYPKVTKLSVSKRREEKIEEKKKAKEDANLASSPGAEAPAKDDDSETFTYEDYIKQRRKSAIT